MIKPTTFSRLEWYQATKELVVTMYVNRDGGEVGFTPRLFCIIFYNYVCDSDLLCRTFFLRFIKYLACRLRVRVSSADGNL